MRDSWLPPLLGSGLLALMLGIGLGESTISLVKPIFYSPLPLSPRERGAIFRPRAAPVSPFVYGWDDGALARQSDCEGCGAQVSIASYSATVPYFGEWRESVPSRSAMDVNEPEVAKVEPIQMSQPDPRVLRYTSFPVEEPAVEEPASDDEREVEISG